MSSRRSTESLFIVCYLRGLGVTSGGLVAKCIREIDTVVPNTRCEWSADTTCGSPRDAVWENTMTGSDGETDSVQSVSEVLEVLSGQAHAISVECNQSRGGTISRVRWICELEEHTSAFEDIVCKSEPIRGDEWTLAFGVNLTELPSAASRRLLVDKILHVLARSAQIRSGFVSCFNAEHTNATTLFTSFLMTPYLREYSLQEAAWWDPATNRDEMVRGVYWGNIWGPRALARIRESGDLLAEIPKWKWKNEEGLVATEAAVRELPGGAAFVTLTKDVLDSHTTEGLFSGKCDGWPTALSTWLHVELRKRGMLA
jgi:hypothetical protein